MTTILLKLNSIMDLTTDGVVIRFEGYQAGLEKEKTRKMLHYFNVS